MMADVIRKAVWSIDPAASVPEVRSLGGVVAGSVETRRFEMGLLLLFAISAWLLAGLGVYGVVSYSVVQRRQEIGLRMALGARRGALLWMVMREAFGLFGAGLALGFPCAYLLGRHVSSQLFGVVPADLGTAAVALITLAMVAAGAAFVPARRAGRIDPIQALHHE
jgi:ABC-type antimicrobial peptide transport system permease subunit